MTVQQLYPRERHPRDKSGRPWRVEYNLAYDGGGTTWTGFYRTRLGARLSAWRHVHISSWGGSAVLHGPVETPEPQR